MNLVKAGSTASLQHLLAAVDQREGPGSALQIVAQPQALAAAVTRADEDMVRLLLGAKADPDGDKHVIEAAGLADATILRLLLQAKAQLRQHPYGGSALSTAAEKGRTASVQILLSAKAEPSARATLHAASAGRVDVMRVLLAAKAQLDGDAFARAANLGRVGMVHLLLAAKAHPDTRALSSATPEADNAQIMRMLLAAKAQPDEFALCKAAKAGHGDVLRVLLAAKAQPVATALKLAVRAGSGAAVQVLLAAKADASASGEDLVRGAAGSPSEDAVSVVDILVQAKAPVHFNGAVHDAVSESRQSDRSTARVLRLLLQLNPDLGARPDRLVDICAMHGKREAVEVLLQAKAPPDPPIGRFGKDFASPLLTAVANGNAGIVELLVHAKADVHRLDVVKHTPPYAQKIKFVARPLDALILCGMDGRCSGNLNNKPRNKWNPDPIDKPDVRLAKSIDMARTLLSAKTDVLARCIEVEGEPSKLTTLELARRFGVAVPAALLHVLQQAEAQQFASGSGPAKTKHAKGGGASKRPRGTAADVP